MLKQFLSKICCSEEKIEVDLHIEITRINEESLLNEAQKEIELISLNIEDKNDLIYLNETYLYQLKIYIELDKGSIQKQNDFLYIIPEKAPMPLAFNKINRNYHIPLCTRKTTQSVGYAEYSLKNISLNEPYIIYYMRRNESRLEIFSLHATKSFKIIHKTCNKFVISKLKELELCMVYEDDPDFHKQNIESSTKILSSWNTPHQKIDSLKSYSNSLLKNENFETNDFSSQRKTTPHAYQISQSYKDTSNISEFKLVEEKSHQRNFSIFTASKSTCSSSGESYLAGGIENKLTKKRNILQKDLFNSSQNTTFHHKNSLSMNTPNNKKMFKETPSTQEKNKDSSGMNYLIKDSVYNQQLFSYKAIKQSRSSNKSMNNLDEFKLFNKNSHLKHNKKLETNHKSTKSFSKPIHFSSYLNLNERKKESPDQSFFINVNEMSFTEINPKTKMEEMNAISSNHSKGRNNQNLAQFLNVQIENKNSPPENKSEGKSVDTQALFQTPQSKKRLYTVEEVFSISNDSSSINETMCFKFTNTNSDKKGKNMNMKFHRNDKIQNITNVVEEDEELSLNHITANEISSQEDRFFNEKSIDLDDNNSKIPNFLKIHENKQQFIKAWKSFNQKFKELGFYLKLDFNTNTLIIYYEKSCQIYQIYRFKEFKKINEIFSFLEDIHASVKFALL